MAANFFILAILAIKCLFFADSRDITDEQLLRETKFGTVLGSVFEVGNEQALVFNRIPYARPPIEDLRFKRAEVPLPWDGVLNATQEAPFCVQFWYEGTQIDSRLQDEDCLYLNIITPIYAHPTYLGSRKLPVLVWIHGGSYQVGGMQLFPIEGFIKSFVSKGLVVVTVNYRLGPLGFLSLMSKDCAGNFGLSDQLLALQWIQDNIAQFGGDPDEISISGESAGGASASLLAVAKQTQGLIQRVIIRSGSSLSKWAVRSRNTDLNSHTLLRLTNCYSTDADMSLMMNCLRHNTTVDELVAAWRFLAIDDMKAAGVPNHVPINKNHPLYGHTYFTPVVDSFMLEDSIVEDYPERLIKTRARVPIMIGLTSAECMGYLTWLKYSALDSKGVTTADPLRNLVPEFAYRYPQQIKEAIGNQYFGKSHLTQGDVTYYTLIQVASDANFVSPTLSEAELYSNRDLDVFVYMFDHSNDPLTRRFKQFGVDNMFGTPHGFDIAFLMGSMMVLDGDKSKLSLTSEDEIIAAEIADSMTSFIKHNNPDGGWKQYSSECLNINYISRNHSRDYTIWDRHVFWTKTIPSIEALMLTPQHYTTPAAPSEQNLWTYRHGFFISSGLSGILLLSTCLFACLHFGTRNKN